MADYPHVLQAAVGIGRLLGGVGMEKLFPKINTTDEAKKISQQGAVAGLVFAGMYAIGIVFVLWAGKSPVDRSAVAADERIWSVAGSLIVTLLILLAAWRVSTGKGFISASLLLAAFLFEVAMKVVGGTAGLGWIVFYIFVTVAMFNGVRATWAYRQIQKSTTVSADAGLMD